MTIKDALETAGVRTTGGHPPLRDYLPSRDAPAVARLRAAGAILLGKTNVPPLSADYRADNPIFGRTNNPWDLDRTPGGSTGGGAAAVAAAR
jgi:amidase